MRYRSQLASLLAILTTPLLLLQIGCEPSTQTRTPTNPQPIVPHMTTCDLTAERIVFTSKMPVQGSNLRGTGPLNGNRIYADDQCSLLAAGSMHYKLEYSGKKWAAWLSIPVPTGVNGYSAIERIRSRITDPNKPWSIRYGADCAVVFKNADALGTSPQLPIAYDEDAVQVEPGTAAVWTGTDSNGRTAAASMSGALPPQCVDRSGVVWSDPSAYAVYGSINKAVNWSNANADVSQLALLQCNQQAHLYCFEVDTN